ncbi:hypothetical protein PFISCL1PPCAC_25579, partial [Pristionchus fissidentatus]
SNDLTRLFLPVFSSSSARDHAEFRGSFWFNRDRKALMIEETPNHLMTGVEVNLTRESDKEILSSLLLPIRFPSSLVSFPLDIWLPLVFDSGETFKSVDEIIPNHRLKKKKKLSEFSLVLTPIYSNDNSDDSLPTKIQSEYPKIGSTSIAVSRELLSLHSDFFSALFYSDFMERNQKVKEIKDIDESEFVNFLQSLHRGIFEFVSMRSALDTLGFADRFLMPYISKRVLP